MGRYDLRPLQVHPTATALLRTPRLRRPPPWFDIVGRVPPAQTLVRPQPVQHHENRTRPKTRKPSRMFLPQTIRYPEDELRRDFYADHPWELARPRVVLEDDGKDAQRQDWSQLQQFSRAVDGESVVQRQSWLMQHVPKMTKAQAYDQARREFYAVRYAEDVERRVAKEEALSTGAYFGKSYLQVGMELEDRSWEEWKRWARSESRRQEHRRLASYSGLESGDSEVLADLDVSPDTDVVIPVPSSTPPPPPPPPTPRATFAETVPR